MKTKIVKITSKDGVQKEILVTERKIKDLIKLANELSGSLDAALKCNTAVQFKEVIQNILLEKLPLVFPGLTFEDIEEAYPSEINELFEAFIDLNFFALKRLFPTLMTLVRAGLQSRFSLS